MSAPDVVAQGDRDESPPDQVLRWGCGRQERAKRDVGLALRQVEVPGIGVQLELDAWMLRAQPGQGAQQDLRDERVGAGHAHRPLEPRVLPREAALEGGHLALHPLGAHDHLVARLRQQVAVAVAVEQLRAEPRLQGLHAPRHGRVAHAQRGAGRAHRARAGEGEKVAHVIPVHRLRERTPRWRTSTTQEFARMSRLRRR